MAIRHLLVNKDLHERANIKASEIVKQKFSGQYFDEKYGIAVEVLSISKIERGVEVLARAWKGDKQLGFGANGSVEWERFRFFNPPVLVPDPNGDVIKEQTDERSGEIKVRRLREDPEAALKQILAETIK